MRIATGSSVLMTMISPADHSKTLMDGSLKPLHLQIVKILARLHYKYIARLTNELSNIRN
jgi:hypothetical protein